MSNAGSNAGVEGGTASAGAASADSATAGLASAGLASAGAASPGEASAERALTPLVGSFSGAEANSRPRADDTELM